jgi:lipopolysaccharide export system protein LptC
LTVANYQSHETVLFEQRQRAFGQARRHTWFIRVMRFVLPATTLSLAGGILITSGFFTPSGPILESSSIGIENGVLTMENARLTGIDEEDRPYEVNAITASERLNEPGVINLDGINAALSGGEKSWSSVVARSGQYDRDQEVLRLEEDVLVRSGEGYDVSLDSAYVDLRAGTVTSDDPVEIEMMNGTLRAQGMTIENKGEILRFFDGVSLRINPSQDAGEPSETDAGIVANE